MEAPAVRGRALAAPTREGHGAPSRRLTIAA